MRALTITVALLLLASTSVAEAQRRGGRFGGSRGFRSSSRSSPSSRSYRSRSSRSSFGTRRSRGSSRSRFGTSRSSTTTTGSTFGSTPSTGTTPPPPSRETKARDSRFRTDHVPAVASTSDTFRLPEPSAGRPLPTRHAPRPSLEHPLEQTPPRYRAGILSGAGCGGATFVLWLVGWLMLRASRRRQEALRRAASGGAGGGPVASRGPPGAASGPSPSAGPCEVRRISIGFDWTQRARLQQALDQLAGQHDMDSADGMHAAARQAQSLLRSSVEAARYGAFSRYHETAERAEGRFVSAVNDLASRFAEETITDGHRRELAAMQAQKNEGEGLVVISLVIGSMRHLPELPGELSPAAIAHALATSVPESPDDLVAFEVVWSPSEDGDRMSSAELEMVYPDLARLDDSSEVGRIVCGYCRAPYPAELGRCPSCGAPVTS